MRPIRDLHTHTTASDGSLKPAELMCYAAEQGVEVMAVTDHDTTAGLNEAILAAKRVGIGMVPGVEISVRWEGLAVHVLGLGLRELRCRALQDGLAELRRRRRRRAEEIDRHLAGMGVFGALEGASALASRDGNLGRIHFARYLVERGAAGNLRTAFNRFLADGRPAYVPGEWAELEQAVSWIRAAKGLPVVAHPARYRLSGRKRVLLLREFQECGGLGLEVISGCHNSDECFRMARLANDFRLFASVGSDYHGAGTSWLRLGRLPPVPGSCRPIWEAPGWMAAGRPAVEAV